MMHTFTIACRAYLVAAEVGSRGDRLWWTMNTSGKRVTHLVALAFESRRYAVIWNFIVGPLKLSFGWHRGFADNDEEDPQTPSP